MGNSNTETAKNIVIRNLSDEDREMLGELRDMLGGNSNSSTIMKAGHKLLELQARHDQLQKESNDQERTIGSLRTQIMNTELKIESYFQAIHKKDLAEDELIAVITHQKDPE